MVGLVVEVGWTSLVADDCLLVTACFAEVALFLVCLIDVCVDFVFLADVADLCIVFVFLADVAEVAAEAADPELRPGPETLVVRSPFSMYTPEKRQSSAAVSVRPVVDGRRRTPRCQSAPFDEAETLTGPTVFTKSLAPVEW